MTHHEPSAERPDAIGTKPASMMSGSSPVERLLADLRRMHPDLSIERLRVTHPADDDNVWFVRLREREVQIDCRRGGLPPFLIEGNGGAPETADDVELAAAVIGRMLAH